ncbi:TatD family hydrolase [Aliivibrio sp. S2TY2]|uniref:TatD family hydrolase n=1 Tax=unclassified Aliivibrio TaxID=2645654 RepID=UPI00237818F3|nr:MULTISPECIES: TatD family hydrolase [unclassified Aliivibrio]MDD9175931.1 TatD family hydrolase [Aliivibrio sp. S3TY1]MDD9193154.1 TatD family hydrolase [Aliivibrio sp. S2TY2]
MMNDKIKYIDFHCHCDLLPDFDKHSFKINEEVAAVAVTTTPLAWEKNVEVSKCIPTLYPALGMHPQLISSRLDDFKSFGRHFERARIIGEIGLDGSKYYKDSLVVQEEVLSRILGMCAQSNNNKILSIHSLRAEVKIIKHLKGNIYKKPITPILHWFTGSIPQASQLLDIGAKFSFNHKMIATKGGQQLLVHLPVEAILIETDLPFTSKTYDSMLHKNLLARTVKEVSNILPFGEEECSNIILRNAKELLLTSCS